METLSHDEILEVKQKYKPGMIVELIEMEGEMLSRGLRGKVRLVDDIGQIHVDWFNGSALALQPEHDTFFVVDNATVFLEYEPGSPEYERLDHFKDKMNKKFEGTKYQFCLKNIYFDFGLSWKYTAVVAEDLKKPVDDVLRSWQVLTPAEHTIVLKGREKHLDEIVEAKCARYLGDFDKER